MNEIKLIIIFTVVISLQGCGAMFAKMASSNFPSSKYNAIPFLEDEVENYFSELEKVSHKGDVVSDKLGSYFIKKEKEGIYSRFTLLNQDASVLKNSLSSSVGLMEPMYSLDLNLTVKLNWSETKRKYRFYTKVLGLKLLPLKYTKKYHHQIASAARKKGKKHISDGIFSMNTASKLVAAENGLYNPEYYKNILSKVTTKADYLISHTMANFFYEGEFGKHVSNMNNYPGKMTPEAQKAYDRAHKDKADPLILAYETYTKNFLNYSFSTINFLPTSYFETLESGGGIRLYSGCRIESKAIWMEGIKNMNDATAIPFASAISVAVKQNEKLNDKEYLRKIKNDFKKAMKEEHKIQKLTELACKKGYKAMGLSGVIRSKKLR